MGILLLLTPYSSFLFNCYCTYFQQSPDLYALAADKIATQHIAKSHHSWQPQTPSRIYCHSPTRIFSQTAKSTCAIIPFVQACPAPAHALQFAVLFCPIISTSNLPLFHIIFTGSLYVSLYIIFTKIKPLF